MSYGNKTNANIRLLAAALLAGASFNNAPLAADSHSTAQVEAENPRLIVITDIGTEPDDMESFVRLLTYANDH